MLPHPTTNKRYHTLDAELKATFGRKVAKLSLDAGFTCPTRDGSLSSVGCLFCGAQGAGDFTSAGTIREQMQQQASNAARKWGDCPYIAYFQSHTNTYAPVQELDQRYREALAFPNTVGLAIATRPDCLPDDVLGLLETMNRETYLWVELGLQTMNDNTAAQLNRGFTTGAFLKATEALRKRNIRVVVHLIAGLPGENKETFLEGVKAVAQTKPWGIKIHMLHITSDAPLASVYQQKPFPLLSQEDYIDWVVEALTYLPPETVVHRLTGDGNAKTLLAPNWTRDKLRVISGIDSTMKARGYVQGCCAVATKNSM